MKNTGSKNLRRIKVETKNLNLPCTEKQIPESLEGCPYPLKKKATQIPREYQEANRYIRYIDNKIRRNVALPQHITHVHKYYISRKKRKIKRTK